MNLPLKSYMMLGVTSLSLSFLIHKMTMISGPQGRFESEMSKTHKALGTMWGMQESTHQMIAETFKLLSPGYSLSQIGPPLLSVKLL